MDRKDMQHTPDKLAELAEKGYYTQKSFAQAVKALYIKSLASGQSAQEANLTCQTAFDISKNTVYKYIR